MNVLYDVVTMNHEKSAEAIVDSSDETSVMEVERRTEQLNDNLPTKCGTKSNIGKCGNTKCSRKSLIDLPYAERHVRWCEMGY